MNQRERKAQYLSSAEVPGVYVHILHRYNVH